MPKVKELAKKDAEGQAITPAQRQLVDAATVIRQDPADASAAFMARHLVQCTLPHSDPGRDAPRWMRRSGNAVLVIRPGWDAANDRPAGYPYGVIPRLVLFWLITELVHQKDRADLTPEQKRTVYLGRSLYDFMHRIGLDPQRGGKRSDRTRLQDQMQRLFRATISFDVVKEVDGRRVEKWLDMKVAPEGEIWWDTTNARQSTLWESVIVVSEQFYKAVTAIPVPVDERALRALKRSPLALDLYALLSYTTFVARKIGEPIFVSWHALAGQLGGHYEDVDNLKKKVQGALPKVRVVYPGLDLRTRDGGFDVLPTGQPAIAPRRA